MESTRERFDENLKAVRDVLRVRESIGTITVPKMVALKMETKGLCSLIGLRIQSG